MLQDIEVESVSSLEGRHRRQHDTSKKPICTLLFTFLYLFCSCCVLLIPLILRFFWRRFILSLYLARTWLNSRIDRLRRSMNTGDEEMGLYGG
jgi:hypothetical protein